MRSGKLCRLRRPSLPRSLSLPLLSLLPSFLLPAFPPSPPHTDLYASAPSRRRPRALARVPAVWVCVFICVGISIKKARRKFAEQTRPAIHTRTPSLRVRIRSRNICHVSGDQAVEKNNIEPRYGKTLLPPLLRLLRHQVQPLYPWS